MAVFSKKYIHYCALCNKNENIDFIRIMRCSEYIKRKEEKIVISSSSGWSLKKERHTKKYRKISPPSIHAPVLWWLSNSLKLHWIKIFSHTEEPLFKVHCYISSIFYIDTHQLKYNKKHLQSVRPPPKYLPKKNEQNITTYQIIHILYYNADDF